MERSAAWLVTGEAEFEVPRHGLIEHCKEKGVPRRALSIFGLHLNDGTSLRFTTCQLDLNLDLTMTWTHAARLRATAMGYLGALFEPWCMEPLWRRGWPSI